MTCFVLGCSDRLTVFVERDHRLFGSVVSCLRHDPQRHGYERVVAPAEALAPPEAPVVDANGRGGSRVPRVPRVPRQPSPAGVVNPF